MLAFGLVGAPSSAVSIQPQHQFVVSYPHREVTGLGRQIRCGCIVAWRDVRIYVRACVCICLFAYVYIYIYIYIYVFTYINVAVAKCSRRVSMKCGLFCFLRLKLRD